MPITHRIVGNMQGIMGSWLVGELKEVENKSNNQDKHHPGNSMGQTAHHKFLLRNEHGAKVILSHNLLIKASNIKVSGDHSSKKRSTRDYNKRLTKTRTRLCHHLDKEIPILLSVKHTLDTMDQDLRLPR